jgi:NAD(P)-dependent dehydrogenase (short-subunit alcohol dehydrogenase family)
MTKGLVMTLLQGRKALITGGASGIGKATCLAFAREGASVCVVDRNGEQAHAVAGEIRAAGGKAMAHRADVSLESDVRRMVEAAESGLGGIDCCFNNAGIGTFETNNHKTRLCDISLEDWNRMLCVNLTGVFLCLKYQIPRLASGSSIVNTASIAGLTALHGAAAYVASKHGVIALTKSAAIEYGHQGIRVNAVCPGHVVTPLIGEVHPQDEVAKRNPMRRYGTPQEIADLVVWLSCSQASFVNGSVFTADGGRLAGG